MHPTVDRVVARQHLQLANKHVSEGRLRVEAQRALVARLERDGHDTLKAKTLLEQFQTTLALQVESRDRIVQELGESE